MMRHGCDIHVEIGRALMLFQEKFGDDKCGDCLMRGLIQHPI